MCQIEWMLIVFTGDPVWNKNVDYEVYDIGWGGPYSLSHQSANPAEKNLCNQIVSL